MANEIHINSPMCEDPSVYALDPESDERASVELLDEPGWYVSDPTTARFTRVQDDDGREVWIINTLGEGVTGKRVRLQARVSPEKNAEGEVDFKYQMYNHPETGLRQAYKKTVGDSPTSSKHVEDFLTNYPVRMKLSRTGVRKDGSPTINKKTGQPNEPGTMVVAFGRAVRT